MSVLPQLSKRPRGTARDLALAPKRCETCLPATIRVTNGEGEGAKHLATIRQLSHVGAFIESRTLLRGEVPPQLQAIGGATTIGVVATDADGLADGSVYSVTGAAACAKRCFKRN